jgi:hypothetical protein
VELYDPPPKQFHIWSHKLADLLSHFTSHNLFFKTTISPPALYSQQTEPFWVQIDHIITTHFATYGLAISGHDLSQTAEHYDKASWVLLSPGNHNQNGQILNQSFLAS